MENNNNKQITKEEFISKIRDKFPQYKDVGDEKLYNTYIEKYPQYKNVIKENGIIKNTLGNFIKGGDNLVGGLVGGAVEGLGNVAGLAVDAVGMLPGTVPNLGENIRKLGTSGKEAIYNITNVDNDSYVTKGGEMVSDLVGASKIKIPEKVGVLISSGKISKSVGNLIAKYGNAFKDKFPFIYKTLSTSTKSALELGKYGAVNEGTIEGVKSDAELGAVFGAGGSVVKSGFDKVAAPIYTKLQLSDLITPSKINLVGTKLKQIGEKLPSVFETDKNVATWMIDRGIKGSAYQMVEKLNKHYKKAEDIFNNNLGIVKQTFQPDRVKDGLIALAKEIKDVKGLEKNTAEVFKLGNKFGKEGLTIKEINRVKNLMDEHFGIFTMHGETKTANVAKGLANIRKDIKVFIEDVANANGVKGIRQLNNEKAVSKVLAEAIGTKETGSAGRDLAFHLAANPIAGGVLGAAVGAAQGKDVGGTISGAIGGGVAMGVLGSKRIKTNLATIIRNLSKTELEKIQKFDWAKYIPKEYKDEIEKRILKLSKKSGEFEKMFNNK